MLVERKQVISGAYGHTLGDGVGYVPCAPNDKSEDMLSRRHEIEVAGTRFVATASLQSLL